MKTICTKFLALIPLIALAGVVCADPRPAAGGQGSTVVSREAVVIYHEDTEPAIAFAAGDLVKTLRSLGHHPVTLQSLAAMPAETP